MAQFEIYQLILLWFASVKTFVFEWDDGNVLKSLIKHKVSPEEAEEVFRERRFVVLGIQVSPPVPQREERFGIIGQTKSGRKLMVSFTRRNEKVRVISARPMSRAERKRYESDKAAIETTRN